MLKAKECSDSQAIAIIGTSCRFPNIQNTEEFWSLLKQGGSTLKRIDRATLKKHGRTDEEIDHPAFVPVGGHMNDVDRFDAGFFGITPREASLMDPQLRFMLETAWHIFEDAGKDPHRNAAYTGVFASTNISTYLLRNLLHEVNSDQVYKQALSIYLNGQDYIATWIAYQLGLTGPAMNVQTACSSGLSNVAVACQNLLNRSCDLALSLSGTIQIPQNRGYGYMGGPDFVLSKKGVCRPFDADSDGTIFTDGIAGFLLRRLEDAQADGDRIIAVIKGFGLSNDGHRKPNYYMLSVEGQLDAITQALAMADLNPSDLGYIEAHGTGVRLGDPIEFTALHDVYGNPNRTTPCLMGSVKGNTGHALKAAGASGLLKAALVVQKGEIPATLNFKTLNPHITVGDTALRVVNTFSQWDTGGAKRRAGVNSLGIGGANCHIILEEAPPQRVEKVRAPTCFTLVISARSREALEELRYRYLMHLNENPSPEELTSLCFTATHGRAHLPWRMAVSGPDAEALSEALRHMSVPQSPISPVSRLIFVFGGHGISSFESVPALSAHIPTFQSILEEGLTILGPRGSVLRSLLWGETSLEQAQPSELQTAIVLYDIALGHAWKALGLAPTHLMGHSLGEIAAAEMSGMLTFQEALELAWARGTAIQNHAPHGRMLAVMTSEKDVIEILREPALKMCSLAAINSEQQTVVSGDSESLPIFEQLCLQKGIRVKSLPIPYAYHSPFMEEAAQHVTEAAKRMTWKRAHTPVISTMMGIKDDGQMAQAGYWGQQLRQPVRFRDSLNVAMCPNTPTVFLEISAHSLYEAAAQSTLLASGAQASWIPSSRLHGMNSPLSDFENSRAQLFMLGYATDMTTVGGWANLPKYPFADTRFWIDPQPYSPCGPLQDAVPASSERATPPLLPIHTTEEDALIVELKNLWADRIGAPVHADSNFFELAGTSIIALAILSDIEKSLGIRLPLATFFEAKTVRALAHILENKLAETLDLELA